MSSCKIVIIKHLIRFGQPLFHLVETFSRVNFSSGFAQVGMVKVVGMYFQ